MARKKKFIREAIKRSGALTARAKRAGALTARGTIKPSFINAQLSRLKKMSAGDKKLSPANLRFFKQLNLAKTLRGSKVPPPGRRRRA